MLIELAEKLKTHSGKFICSMTNNKTQQKIVEFKHLTESALEASQLEKLKKELGHIPGLIDFYETWSCVTLYFDSRSEDSAFYFANPNEWTQLKDYFSLWIELDDDEQDLLPSWLESYETIGEIPHSGNYLLMPTSGKEAGSIYEFEHDGFDFIFIAHNLEDCISKLLNPDPGRLLDMASHLSFIEEDTFQWWIEELVTNDGKSVKPKRQY